MPIDRPDIQIGNRTDAERLRVETAIAMGFHLAAMDLRAFLSHPSILSTLKAMMMRGMEMEMPMDTARVRRLANSGVKTEPTDVAHKVPKRDLIILLPWEPVCINRKDCSYK